MPTPGQHEPRGRPKGAPLVTALRRSEEEFSLLVGAVRDYAIFMLDPGGRVASWNAGAELIKGYRADEIIGESFERFYLPEEAAAGAPQQHLEDARRNGAYRETGERLRKDGTRFWADVLITPLYDDDGKLRGFAKVTRDITEQIAQSRALADSEARFRALADNIAQLAWMADSRGHIFWYNRRWLEYTGSTLEAMAGWGWMRVHHPEHVERVVARIQRAWDTGEEWEDTFPLRGKDGRYRWFLSRAMPIRDAQGNLKLWFGTNTDITEQRETMRALAESERRLRFTLESSLIGDWEVDFATGRVHGSPQQWRILGFDGRPPDWTSERFAQLVHPEDRPRVMRLIDEAMAGRAELHYECRIVRPDGAVRWIEVHAAMRRGGEGEHMSGIVHDITARKESEEEVRRLAATLESRVQERTAQLAEANLEMQAFNYTVSHDLRAPLRGVRGFAQVLLEDFSEGLGEAGREYCRRIAAAGERMERLVDDLLAYGRLSRQELSLKPVELEPLVDEVVQQFPDGGVRVEPPLPVVRGHRPMLVQVLHNLIGNAVKFVPPGVKPEVLIRGERDGTCARLYVDDNGIGIAPQHRERIFRVFERLHGDEEYPGTGIGLAIVRRAMERMGGRAEMQPRAQGGSRFIVELPAP